MGRYIRLVVAACFGLILLSACRESIPGKYSYQEQLADSMEQTLTAVTDANMEMEEQTGAETTAEPHEMEATMPVEGAPEPASTEDGHQTTAHWSYSGDTGPEYWAELNPDYALCGNGKMQSPVDISGVEMSDLPDIVYSYHPSALSEVNNGHSIQVNFDDGSSIEIDGVLYHLKQLHFHGPSEHTINGQYFSMEMHLVHQNDAGEYAVIGVMIQTGDENSQFESVLEYMPEMVDGEEHPESIMIDAMQLLPEDKTYYRLDGSLTTPPCTEGVKWIILKNPIQLSVMQIARFEALYIHNNRPVQMLNDRIIYEQSK